MATWCRNRSTCRGGTVIDPRLAFFAAGATFGLVLRGWPWHPRFSRYSRVPTPNRPGPYSSCARGFAPPPTALGTRREYLYSPSTMAECGGPCFEAWDPRACDCGQLWRDVPIRMDEGSTQRGNGNGGPSTPKPGIISKPQFPSPRKIREDFLP